MGTSKWFFSMSGVILLIGALAIAGKGINFGIDFDGGTRITAPLEQAGDGRRRCATRSRRSGLADAKIQTLAEPGARASNVVQISTKRARPGRRRRGRARR